MENKPATFLAHSGKYTNIDQVSKQRRITVQDLKKPNEYYEIIGTYLKKVEEGEKAPDPINLKAFIDLDGSFDGSQKDFEILNEKIREKLLHYEPILGLRESSMYEAQVYRWNTKTKTNDFHKNTNKLSFTITYRKMTPCLETMKNYIITEELPKLQDLLHGIIEITDKSKPNTLNIDTAVYSHRKMRCPNAYKEKEQPERISKVMKGSLEDNIIQIVQDDYEVIPKNEIVVKPKKEQKEQKEKSKKKDVEEEVEEYFKVFHEVQQKAPSDFTDITKELCENIPASWYDYTEWIKILWVFKNEGWDYKIFDEYSKKYGKEKYDANYNKDLWEQPKKYGYYEATLWHFLKKCNMEKFKQLQSKRKDFYKVIEEQTVNNLDLAILFFQLHPNKYIYSSKSKWWEYKPSNILVNTGDEKPTSLLNNIGESLRAYFNEQRGLLDMEDKNYKARNEAIGRVYCNLGKSSFCKGIIDFLPHYYLNNDIEALIDSNTNLLAFTNCVYDLENGKFRAIKPDDYISRTCGYFMSMTKQEETRKEIYDLLESIFPDKETRDYYIKATALSFFTNRFESFYVLTGKGRNGKGVLDKIIKRGLGEYHYTADPSFLTSVIKYGVPNPTLSECKGVRYLSVSEPDTGAENCCLNVEFVKGLTGKDDITTRGLFEKNKTFKNTFSTFLQCNNKPTLNKIDKAIVERLKCIPFTERFIANPDPTDPHQHKCNNKLKDIVTDLSYVIEFMHYMLEVAHANKDIESLTISELCKESTAEYIEENNAFKYWFEANYKRVVAPENFKTLSKEEKAKYTIRTKTSTLLAEYNANKPKNEQLTAKKLRGCLTFNDIDVETYVGTPVIKGYEKIEQADDDIDYDLDN